MFPEAFIQMGLFLQPQNSSSSSIFEGAQLLDRMRECQDLLIFIIIIFNAVVSKW